MEDNCVKHQPSTDLCEHVSEEDSEDKVARNNQKHGAMATDEPTTSRNRGQKALMEVGIGHMLRKPASNITRQALRWNPQGKRKRGRPRNSWRRDLYAECQAMGQTWGQL
jgi:hypothetical protein